MDFEATIQESGGNTPRLDRLDTALKPFTTFLHDISAVSTLVMMIVTVIDVIGRYFFGKPLTGSMEIVELLMILAAYPAFIWVEHQSKHLNVDMVTSAMSQGWQGVTAVFQKTACLAFLFLLGYEMLGQTVTRYQQAEATLVLGIPIWPIILLIAVSFWVLALFNVLTLIKAWYQAAEHGKHAALIGVVLLALAFTVIPLVMAGTRLGIPRNGFGGAMMLYMFLMILSGMPIGIAMITVGMQGLMLLNSSVDIALAAAASSPFASIAHIPMSVIPMFVLLGEFALIGGISTDLFDTASKWLNKLPGGLAIASVSGCAGFAAVCGDSLATAMTMASVAMPAMKEKGYEPAFAAASLSIGGTLGILIPPSMGFIMYAIVTEESVARLFLAGVFPGLLLTTIICVTIICRVKMNPSIAPSGIEVSWGERIKSLWGVVPMLTLFSLIMGGILTGFCTPTEGGAIGSFACFLYCIARKRMNLKNLMSALRATALLSAKIFIILVGVTIVGYFLASTRLPMVLSNLIVGSGLSKYVTLFFIILLYTVLGCLMNVIPMILLVLPSLFPAVVALGFDPIWFGVITVLLMELGQITPPVGVLVFALSSVTPEVPLLAIFREVVPYFIAIFVCAFILILFPQIALWLPNTLM